MRHTPTIILYVLFQSPDSNNTMVIGNKTNNTLLKHLLCVLKCLYFANRIFLEFYSTKLIHNFKI